MFVGGIDTVVYILCSTEEAPSNSHGLMRGLIACGDAKAGHINVADRGRRSAEAALGASDNAKTSRLKVNPVLEPPKLSVSERHSARLEALEKRERGGTSPH